MHVTDRHDSTKWHVARGTRHACARCNLCCAALARGTWARGTRHAGMRCAMCSLCCAALRQVQRTSAGIHTY